MTEQQPPVKRPRYFGPDRVQPGHDDIPWAVWVTGMDDVHPYATAGECLLALANWTAILLAADDGSALTPRPHAVILKDGYLWAQDTEHKMGLDCGVPACVPCQGLRAAVKGIG